MTDQADPLRKLVIDRIVDPDDAARIGQQILVLGARPGDGATTVATQLAASLARSGGATICVDADLTHGDAARGMGIEATVGIETLLRHQASVEDLLVPTSAEFDLLPLCGPIDPLLVDDASRRRVLCGLKTLDAKAAHVVIDGGSHGQPFVDDLATLADFVVIVATSEQQSVMDAYALIKRCITVRARTPHRAARMVAVINQVTDAQEANEACDRLETTCQQFLQSRLYGKGQLPRVEAMSELLASTSPLAAPIDQLAHALTKNSPPVAATAGTMLATRPTENSSHFEALVG